MTEDEAKLLILTARRKRLEREVDEVNSAISETVAEIDGRAALAPSLPTKEGQ